MPNCYCRIRADAAEVHYYQPIKRNRRFASSASTSDHRVIGTRPAVPARFGTLHVPTRTAGVDGCSTRACLMLDSWILHAHFCSLISAKRGKANPSRETIETLAGGLKVSVKALFEDRVANLSHDLNSLTSLRLPVSIWQAFFTEFSSNSRAPDDRRCILFSLPYLESILNMGELRRQHSSQLIGYALTHLNSDFE